MKLTKTASGKLKVSFSKKDWVSIGQKSGWFKKAQLAGLGNDLDTGAPGAGVPGAGVPGGGLGEDPIGEDPIGDDLGGEGLGGELGRDLGSNPEDLKQQIIAALESGDFGKAKELTNQLPVDSQELPDSGLDAGPADDEFLPDESPTGDLGGSELGGSELGGNDLGSPLGNDSNVNLPEDKELPPLGSSLPAKDLGRLSSSKNVFRTSSRH